MYKKILFVFSSRDLEFAKQIEQNKDDIAICSFDINVTNTLIQENKKYVKHEIFFDQIEYEACQKKCENTMHELVDKISNLEFLKNQYDINYGSLIFIKLYR